MASPPEQRTREIGAIHVARKQLGLSEEEYRSYLDAWTGKSSATKLSQEERRLVIEHFRKMGFQKKAHPDQLQIHDDDDGRVKMIKALWLELYRLGKIEAPTLASLNAFVMRMAKVSHVHFLRNAEQQKAQIVIEGLKKWRDRKPKKTAASQAKKSQTSQAKKSPATKHTN